MQANLSNVNQLKTRMLERAKSCNSLSFSQHLSTYASPLIAKTVKTKKTNTFLPIVIQNLGLPANKWQNLGAWTYFWARRKRFGAKAMVKASKCRALCKDRPSYSETQDPYLSFRLLVFLAKEKKRNGCRSPSPSLTISSGRFVENRGKPMWGLRDLYVQEAQSLTIAASSGSSRISTSATASSSKSAERPGIDLRRRRFAVQPQRTPGGVDGTPPRQSWNRGGGTPTI